MEKTNPSVLGLRKSFGYGDRLGLAGPGHIEAARKFNFAAIFAQQSIRELDRTDRTAEEVMEAARSAVSDAGYGEPWGADADHLKTRVDVERMAAAGYCFFTVDPSSYVNNLADGMNESHLAAEVADQVLEGVFGGHSPESLYLGRTFEIGENGAATFDKESLHRAVTKYGRAIADVENMAGYIAEESGDRPYEIEVSVDETDSPTSILEHLFFALELKRRDIEVVSLAPRFIGDFEKGIDYRGEISAFEDSLRSHAEVARHYGPYKLSMHSGSDKFSIYPSFGRICGDLMHVKTAGTSYLEALRVICRVDTALFMEIACYSAGRFATDIASYHISTTQEDIANLGHDPIDDLEDVYLGQEVGRQLLHVTFGSVLTVGKRSDGQPFKDAILEILRNHEDLYLEVLNAHFCKHLSLLGQG